MKIEHVAIWTTKLEEMKNFYEKFFQGKANEKYVNESKQFESYFLVFEDGTRLELMSKLSLENLDRNYNCSGYAHIAFSIDGNENVDKLTLQLRENGYEIVSNPRLTGDGYYESGFLDPDGNLVELVANPVLFNS